MYLIRQEFHPGGEIRHVLFQVPSPKKFSFEEGNIDGCESSNTSSQVGHQPSVDEKSSPVSASHILDNRSKFRESPKPARRRSFGISLLGKRKIVRAGAVMDELLPRGSLLFLTGTIPGGGRQVELAVAEQAPFLIDRLKSWLSYYRIDSFDCYVWELQKRGMPHLHFVCGISDESKRVIVLERFHDEWCRLLEQASIRSGVDLFRQGFGAGLRHAWRYVQANAQIVEKSVSRYLSKYLAKDCSHKRQCPIPRWWGVSRPLNQEIARRTTTVEMVFESLHAASARFSELTGDIERLCDVIYEYRHKVGLGRTSVGFAGSGIFNYIKEMYSMSIEFNSLPEYSQRVLLESAAVRGMVFMGAIYSRWVRCLSVTDQCRQSLKLLNNYPLAALTGNPADFKRWRKILLSISGEITPMKLKKYCPPIEWEYLCQMLVALWRIEESENVDRGSGYSSVDRHSKVIENVLRTYSLAGLGDGLEEQLEADVIDVVEDIQLELWVVPPDD